MPARQTLPTIWLMTDERLGERMWEAIERVPRGGGVVLRHHRSDAALGERVARMCWGRDLLLAVAGDARFARTIEAAMVHNPERKADSLIVSRSVHDSTEAAAARDADLVFVSPVYASSSHPGGPALELEAALRLANEAGVPAIALGGMNRERGELAIAAGFHGWAGIDAFLRS